MARSVSIDTYTGNFDFLHPDREETNVRLWLPEGAPAQVLSESWPVDNAPDVDGLPPSDVIELIAEREAGYWIKSDREKVRAVISWCREHAADLDRQWAGGRIARNQKQIAELEKENRRLREQFIDIDSDEEDAA